MLKQVQHDERMRQPMSLFDLNGKVALVTGVKDRLVQLQNLLDHHLCARGCVRVRGCVHAYLASVCVRV